MAKDRHRVFDNVKFCKEQVTLLYSQSLLTPVTIFDVNRELASLMTSSTAEWPLAADQSSTIRVGDIQLDTSTRTVRTSLKSARLTVIEFTVLQLLLSRIGSVVSREELVRVALQRSFSPFERSIDMHVSNLRKKLGGAGRGSDYIKTVRGAGYVCRAKPS